MSRNISSYPMKIKFYNDIYFDIFLVSLSGQSKILYTLAIDQKIRDKNVRAYISKT